MALFFLFDLYGIIIALFIAYGCFIYSRRHLYKYTESMPGCPQLPFIGNAHQFAGSSADIMKNIKEILNNHGEDGISKTWLGPKLYIALTHPPSVEIVLNTALEKDSVYRFLKPWIGDGLVSGPVSIWRRHRKMLVPAFNQKILNGFIDIFSEHCNILVKKLSTEIGKGQFDVFKYVTSCTLDMVCETAMGVKMNAQESRNHPYIQAGMEEMELVYKRMFQIWLQPQWIFNLTPFAKAERKNIKALHDFTKAVVRQKRFDFENKNDKIKSSDNSKFKPFLELMLELNEDGNTFSDDELREEVDTLTIVGNDTSAMANSNILLLLGCNPHIQDKAVDELREIYGDSKRPVNKDDLSKMHYLERVIKETMRLFPVSPLVVRHLTKDVKLEKYTLPAGAGCVIAIFGLHRDKKIWGENVDEFDPDRFLPENSINRHPYAYLPFSGGLRNCIGKQYAMMSMKVFLSTVLRSYKIYSNADYKNIEFKAEIMMRPKYGHLISIEPRHKL